MDDAARAVARIRPTGTSSQRHASVSSRSQPVQPGRIPCAASMRPATSCATARRRTAGATAASDGDPPAAQCPATSPSASAWSTPPMPVISPAANTPAGPAPWEASTSTKRSAPMRQPAAIGSSSRGVNPWPTHTASTAIRRSVPGIGAHEASRRCTVTASTRSVPCAATTALPVE